MLRYGRHSRDYYIAQAAMNYWKALLFKLEFSKTMQTTLYGKKYTVVFQDQLRAQKDDQGNDCAFYECPGCAKDVMHLHHGLHHGMAIGHYCICGTYNHVAHPVLNAYKRKHDLPILPAYWLPEDVPAPKTPVALEGIEKSLVELDEVPFGGIAEMVELLSVEDGIRLEADNLVIELRTGDYFLGSDGFAYASDSGIGFDDAEQAVRWAVEEMGDRAFEYGPCD